ncbi:MAG: CapA family protein [Christensenella sp.]|nr:CapA family protein [Christensenella sp.]
MTNAIETIESAAPEPLTPTAQESAARVLLLGGVGAPFDLPPQMDSALLVYCAAHDLRISALHKNDSSAAVWMAQNGIDIVSLAAMAGGQPEEIAVPLSGAALLGAGRTEALANAPVVRCVNDVRIGLLAYSERRTGGFDGRADILGLAVYDRVRMLLSQCDHVIVLVRTGLDDGELPLPEWRARYRRLIDAGASAVVDTGAAKGWEAYKHGLIFYGLGDPMQGASLALSLTLLQNGRLRYEALALDCVDGEVVFSADEAQKQRINEQNDLYMNQAAYIRAVDRMCLRSYEKQEQPHKRGILETLLNANGAAARREEETRLLDLLGDESRRLTILRALALKQGAEGHGGES